MPKRSRKPPSDPNRAAASIIAAITDDEGKNPAAVALGRLGGKKGGAARAKALSARKRSEIAKAAAKARWGDKK